MVICPDRCVLACVYPSLGAHFLCRGLGGTGGHSKVGRRPRTRGRAVAPHRLRAEKGSRDGVSPHVPRSTPESRPSQHVPPKHVPLLLNILDKRNLKNMICFLMKAFWLMRKITHTRYIKKSKFERL